MKTNWAKLTLAALLLTGATASAVIPPQAAHAANITLFRIYTDATHTATQLEAQGIDVWETQPNFAEAPLTSDQINWLQANGWSYTMSRQTSGPVFDSSYHTNTAVEQILADRAAKFKNIATVTTIGNTFEGRPIQVIKISSNKLKSSQKSKALFIGGTHSREISPPEIMLSNMDYLLTNYGTDPDVTWMVDNREIYIIPILNKDGHNRAEQLQNWRKNTDTRWGSDGVDLNRNYDEIGTDVWGNPVYGTSTNPFSIEYCGPTAFSEPETAAVKNFIDSVMGPSGTPATVPNGFKLVVDMHSYGNDIMWPWNWTFDVNQYGAQNDIAKMQMIGDKWATTNTYKSYIGAKMYYTTGDTTDWAYGFHRIPSFTIEVGKTFWPTSADLQTQIAENRQPFLNGIKITDDPYGRAGGPDSTTLSATVANGLLTVTGSADDAKSGSNKNKGVEVFLDNLGARGTGTQATLGSSTNSGAITSFTAKLPTTGLASGKHLVLVESQDDTGAWGAPSATWITLP
ncbi:zinc carboxypeptidase [Tumebacillus sp. ITR2]|uniref:Zinc carboxypeptidase n=1 Tax=Tumebacillus amylolyticus TaxID=2801339 RepID=A0ABS1JFE5_9BACL|nr:M14 family metallopeptidase [Tumebacillus amylolyticus]MBL0389002.1 zinc carboxypeptidase [Tumebacillus amylolyticus]